MSFLDKDGFSYFYSKISEKLKSITKRNTRTHRYTNVTLSSGKWVSDDEVFSDYPYKYELTLNGMSDDWECKTFTVDHTNKDALSILGPFVLTEENKLTLWAASAPGSDILIESMSFEELIPDK